MPRCAAAARRPGRAARAARRARRHRADRRRSVPGRRDGDAVHRPGRRRHEGRPRRDARAGRGRRGQAPRSTRCRLSSSSVARRCRSTESALLPRFDARAGAARRRRWRSCMEPTANALEVGCIGNLNAVVTRARRARRTARGRGSATTRSTRRSRRWRRSPTCRSATSTIDGLVFREVVSVTTIAGRCRGQRGPRPRRGHRQLPLRAEPHARRGGGEAARAARASARSSSTIVGNAPPGPRRACDNPLVTRLARRRAISRCGPKQAWTPVAEFGMAGVDAVNLGPGDPRYAHRDDEQVST